MSNKNRAEFLPPIKRYLNAVERRLHMPLKLRARVMNDFSTSIRARYEAGESYEQIMLSLGSPAKAAAELNEQMHEYTYRKSKWRFLFLAVTIGSSLWILLGKLLPRLAIWILPNNSIGIIGGADGPTSIFVTTFVTGWEWLPAVLLLAVGIVGHIWLCRLKPEKKR